MENRRELATRKFQFFQTFAKSLTRWGLTPNQVSVLSVVFAAVGGYGFCAIKNCFFTGWILAFVGIQMRLLCNMIDGLMAIEGGMKSAAGEIYNDLPDRVSDLILILAASFVVKEPWGRDLGWLAATLALMTAYVRQLGSSMGQKADFSGPMAKQHRMAMLNIALVLVLIGHFTGFSAQSSLIVSVALVVIGLGSFITCWRRLYRLTQFLKQRS